MTDDQRSKSSSGDSLVRLLSEAASTGRPVVSDEVIELPPMEDVLHDAIDWMRLDMEHDLAMDAKRAKDADSEPIDGLGGLDDDDAGDDEMEGEGE